MANSVYKKHFLSISDDGKSQQQEESPTFGWFNTPKQHRGFCAGSC